MQPTTQKENQRPYLENGYNYVAILVYGNEYYVKHFKTRLQAVKYNWDNLGGGGDVLTTRQAIKKYEFLTL